jgi:glycosyltransferase involved in cell wall biosynthesis
MKDRTRVLLLIPHLGGGGAEQVFATLARELPPEKYDLHLGLITDGTPGADPIPRFVSIHLLNSRRVRYAPIRVLRLVWQLRPDVILSGMAHLNLLVLALGPFLPSHTRILVRQNGTASSALAATKLPSFVRLCYRSLYRHADRVICQSVPMADDLCATAGLSPSKVTVLRNPIDIDRIRRICADSKIRCPEIGPHLLAVGRLSSEKGFDLLLDAFSKVRTKIPTATLLIAGAGPSESALKEQSITLGLNGAVKFLGWVVSPAEYFKGTSLFVLPSRHEGMPNALLEAAAAGLPIVALPASGGIVNLLARQQGVWLADAISIEALTISLLAALSHLAPYERFPHPWVEMFRLKHAIAGYENLIDQALRKQHA